METNVITAYKHPSWSRWIFSFTLKMSLQILVLLIVSFLPSVPLLSIALLNIQLVNYPVPSFYRLTFGAFMPLSRSTALILHGGCRDSLIELLAYVSLFIRPSLSLSLSPSLSPSLLSPPSFPPSFTLPTTPFTSLSLSLPSLHPTPSSWTFRSPRFVAKFLSPPQKEYLSHHVLIIIDLSHVRWPLFPTVVHQLLSTYLNEVVFVHCSTLWQSCHHFSQLEGNHLQAKKPVESLGYLFLFFSFPPPLPHIRYGNFTLEKDTFKQRVSIPN